MSKWKTGILFLFIIAQLPAIAQVNKLSDAQANDLVLRAYYELNSNSPLIASFDQRYEGVKGTPFLFDDYRPALIYVRGKDSALAQVPVNINLEKNLAALRFQNGTIGVLPNDKLVRISFMEQKDSPVQDYAVYPAEQVEGAGRSGLRFYQVLYTGKQFLLLKAVHKVMKKADYQGAYSAQVRYDEYISETNYIIRKGDGPYQKTRLKKGPLEKLFAEWGISTSQFSEKPDLDSEAGVAAFLKKLE